MKTAECQIIPSEEAKKLFFNHKKPEYREIGRNVGQYTKIFDGKNYGFKTFYSIVCPPRFTKLPEISELFFYGFARMKIGRFWGLVSARGEDILKAEFDEIHIYHDDSINITAVLIGKNDLFGLYVPEKNLFTEIKYTDFELHEKYIITSSNEFQGILLYDGTEVFKPEHVCVEQFYDLFLATNTSGKKVLNSPNWLEKSAEADEFYPPMNGGIKARLCKNYAMLDFETGKNITQFLYKDLTNFSRAGFAIVKDGISIKCKFIDREGKIHTNIKWTNG